MTPTTPSAAVEQLVQLLGRSRPGIVVDTTRLTRAQYSYDASNYRVVPLGVVYPRDADDVAAAVRAANSFGIPVTCRGSGTSMAGNAIGPGLILDLSKHLRRIVEVDPAARTARVQSGVILDDLQRAARHHQLMFGPDPSSHSRVTIGGMIGNDACGNHSVAYGRTSDHVRELDVVLADGTRAVAGPGYLRAADGTDAAAGDRVAALERELRSLAAVNLAMLRVELGRIPRQVSGYQLQYLLPEHGFNVARALVASEGTLAIVVAATVALVPAPAATSLLVLGYDDLLQAAEDVPAILAAGPSAIEAMDTAIVQTMRGRRGPDSVHGLPEGDAWLYVELDHTTSGADAAQPLLTTVQQRGRLTAARVVTDPAERAALWRVREDGAGLAANLLDGNRAWPGWEDAAVAPDNLADYLREFRRLLHQHGYAGVLYGHFGAGCVHVRIDFDTTTAPGRAAMRAFLTDAAHCVTRHGGTLSGEHGDGRARSELLSIMYSPAALACFRAAKQLFDPTGLLNPGILVDPEPLDRHLPSAPPPSVTPFALVDDFGDLAHAAGRCVGIGRCIAHTGGVMCPSYRATGEERHSTRGRARALQSLLQDGIGADTTGRPSEAEVLDTLDLCLSCKACSTDCPTGTDMATYKSALLDRHYRRRLRPLTHYTLGWLPALARFASAGARPLNAALRLRLIRRLLPLLAGITSHRPLPQFVSRRAQLRALDVARSAGATRRPDAVLFVDTFTRRFRPSLAADAAEVLSDAGIATVLGPDVCCGLTWITTGQLSRARRVLRAVVAALDTDEYAGLPVIVLEPSCAAALAHDLPDLLPQPSAADIAGRVVTFAAALDRLADPGWHVPSLPSEAILQTHCHEYATLRTPTQADYLRGHGITELHEATGCCGLAGNFGFEADHYQTSMDVAALALAPALQRHPTAVVLADGFGCRAQIDHLDPSRRPRHLAELLHEQLTTGTAANERTAP